MHVEVVGATGYLGAHVALHLADIGHEVGAWGHSERVQPKDWQGKIASVSYYDVTRADFQTRLLDTQADAIVYCVSLDHHASEDVDLAQTVNVEPVGKLLAAMRERACNARLLYFSTAQVYGPLSGEVKETDEPKPVNNYGKTHLQVEALLRTFRREVANTVASIRMSNGFGAPLFTDNNCWWLVLNDFCRGAVEHGNIRLKSDGTPMRDFIHVSDVALAVDCLLCADALDNMTYNLGGGQVKSMLELAHLVAEIAGASLGLKIPVLLVDDTLSVGAKHHQTSRRFRYDTRRLSALGYVPKMSLIDGIQEVIDYLQKRSIT